MMTDPIADMLTRIRNAAAIRAGTVRMPASKLKVSVAQVLVEEGYLAGYQVEPGQPSSVLKIDLKYGPDGEQVIQSLQRVSKPGRRVYSGHRKLPKVLRGLGVYVLSTPKGVVSDRVARLENVGGEILCKVS
jgi:small subunit ribosomal protein S8